MANILVTGANGFLGRGLCELWNPEDRIIKVDLYGDVDYVDDLTNLESFQAIVRKTSPRLIIHLAALSNSIGLPKSEDTFSLIGHNVLSSFVVSQASYKERIPYTIAAGSMAEYGDTDKYSAPPTELALLHACPTEAYALSKMISANFVWAGYHTIIRFANLYGPGQKDKVIQKIIKCAIDKDTLSVSGDGSSTRQYIYVDDAVEAIRLIYKKKSLEPCFIEDVNIGPKDEVSVLQLVSIIEPLVSEEMQKLGYTREHISLIHTATNIRPNRVCMDSSLAHKYFGWEPQVSLEEGLRRTIKAAIEEYYGDC